VSDARHGWQEALARTPECIDQARFGDELDAASQAHLRSCAHCQAELALFRELDRDDSTAEEQQAAQWIAAELQRRFSNADNVKPFRRKTLPALYAAAAAIVLVIGAGSWMRFREPGIEPMTETVDVYRSGRLEVVAPAGEIAQAPNELRWTAVPNATHYVVRIAEVDATAVWSARTTQPYAPLPPAAVAQFAPGKRLLWDVQAFRGNEMLASSETQDVRVSIASHGKNR
jgi:hypothetical protein